MGTDTENAVLKFCNDKRHGKRPVGMRVTASKVCVVRYLDMMGTPTFENGQTTSAVLFVGGDWLSVLDQILASGWNP